MGGNIQKEISALPLTSVFNSSTKDEPPHKGCLLSSGVLMNPKQPIPPQALELTLPAPLSGQFRRLHPPGAAMPGERVGGQGRACSECLSFSVLQ